MNFHSVSDEKVAALWLELNLRKSLLGSIYHEIGGALNSLAINVQVVSHKIREFKELPGDQRKLIDHAASAYSAAT
jgi:hypothetical protein